MTGLERRWGISSASFDAERRLSAVFEIAGSRALVELQGNFALFVRCLSSEQLWLARDRLGARAIYFAKLAAQPGWIAGTAASAVLKASGRHFEEDERFIASYFSTPGQAPIRQSAFAKIQALAPGEIVRIEGAELNRDRTPIPMRTAVCSTDPIEAIQQFRIRLDRAVAECTDPVSNTAAMLSGGMDSGPMAVLADEHCRAAGTELIPISWTLKRFPECDETRWIQAFARHLSQPVVALESSDLLPFSDIESFPVNPEAPGYNAFRALVNRCYQNAASLGCKVILNGNAGDELYHPYHLLYLGYIHHREWKHLGRDLSQTFRLGGVTGLWHSLPLRQIGKRALRPLKPQTAPQWLADHARESWQPLKPWPPESADHPFPEYAQQLYGRRMASGRAIEHFQATMTGVERRDPYHNEELVAFMLNAPFSFSYRHRRTKWIMREAMHGLLADQVRLKARTGLLGKFYREGQKVNRDRIRAFLFQKHTEWQHWIKPEPVDRLLNQGQAPGVPPTLIDRCIGYVRWLHFWQNC